MKLFSLVSIILLASCASTSQRDALQDRLSSWNGSSIEVLVAVLGEPDFRSENQQEWTFNAPGMQAARTTASLSNSLAARGTSLGRTLGRGLEGDSRTPAGKTDIAAVECVYRAILEGTTIVRVEAMAISGRCQFDELPTRPTG